MLNKNLDRITQKNKEIKTLEKQISDIKKAKEEMLEGENEQTDDYYRIPAIMQDCKSACNLKWENGGFLEWIYLYQESDHAQHKRHYHL